MARSVSDMPNWTWLCLARDSRSIELTFAGILATDPPVRNSVAPMAEGRLLKISLMSGSLSPEPDRSASEVALTSTWLLFFGLALTINDEAAAIS